MTEYDNELKKFVLERRHIGRSVNQIMRHYGSYLGKQKNERSSKLLRLHRKNMKVVGVCWDCSAN